ncbi:phage portal protein, partial [Peribacillus simplex]|uniref:phage portal protein n=3 Tax=Bacillales TaxID=1385 RepID=UPI0021A9945B
MNWDRIPFICFKYNEEEQPLIEMIKALVDDYDKRISDNSNNLEDLPNGIYVVKNYSGTGGEDFRKNISTYRV